MKQLCDVIHDAASYVHTWLRRQPSVKEESLTDWMLFNISEHSPQVRYKLFTRHEEARVTGADWEWWFVGNTQSLRLRVQAKKAQGTKDIYSELARTNAYGLQIDKLLSDASKQNAIPLYAFFSSIASAQHCKMQQSEGVHLASAHRVYSDFIAPARQKVTPQAVLALSKPLSCVACCPLASDEEVPTRYFRHYFPEAFEVIESQKGQLGVHTDLPTYVQRLLRNDRGEVFDEVEPDDSAEFSSLLVVDLRER